MQIVPGEPIEANEGDVLAVPVLADLTWGPGAEWAVDSLGDWVAGQFDAQEFTGKAGQLLEVPTAGALPYGRVVFVGLGEEADAESLRRAAGTVARATARDTRIVTTLHAVDIDGAVEAVAFGAHLGQYRFDKYKSEAKPPLTEDFVLAGADDATETRVAISHGTIIAAAVALARDLINEPAVAKPPAMLAARAEEIASANGLTIRVYTEDEILEEGFGGLAAVNAGSDQPARMVVIEYDPVGAATTVAIVGKGIVFDSGGLTIKPAASMETMKTDMSGAAAVFATLQAVAELELRVRVIGIAPLTENMTGGKAQRPGDVLTARNGKTIEVLNTDAEGRLILADGLSLAVEREPDIVVDVATLTGSCAIALGPSIAGMWSNDDGVADRVLAAAARAGEKLWRMPLEREYRSHIDSEIADMKNTGERYGGAISASLLLSEFVGETPWAHLDIAGPARSSKAEHYLSKGATGFGVRTLVALVEDLAAD
ncbi:MAG TPA: leucyl aminopeptidase [Acidimicrobiia bacterium]|jgi:leucyl aminopeptidase